ncbi:MAG: SDR family NAD(P)-dependent oxidoreductase [Anaerolineae bacterium]|nr:SDR family NAD(P)-dependent oxidoreductase [Anaerolineae bacterium]
MNDFKGKVAVITGGASGIGRALAERCAAEGMRLVLADIQPDTLAETERHFVERGVPVLAVLTDVAKADSVSNLAEQALATFGGVHLLFNNAGVAATRRIWEHSLADWEWQLGVNLWGVIHGVRTFVPIMLKQNTPCHIVNTASVAGLISGSGLGLYKVSKHAVVTLSETLYWDLADISAQVGVSVLCPGWVQTQIWDSARNRSLSQPDFAPPKSGASAGVMALKNLIQNGKTVDEIADRVFAAIQQNQFYILTHPDSTALAQKRLEAIVDGGAPAQSRA